MGEYTCDICNTASFDTELKLKAHKYHCQKAQDKANEKELDKQEKLVQGNKLTDLHQKDQTQSLQESSETGSLTQEDTPSDPRQLEERVPFGTPDQRFADLPDKDKYHYRVFNDNWRKEPGRVLRAKRAGYEPVGHMNSGSSVGTNEDGSEIKGVLMRIPKEIHEEDVLRGEVKRQEIDRQIHTGKYKQTQGDGRYIPGEGIKISSSQNP